MVQRPKDREPKVFQRKRRVYALHDVQSNSLRIVTMSQALLGASAESDPLIAHEKLRLRVAMG